MNKYSVIAAGVIAGAAACLSAPALAHGGGGWSVTIESQPQPYYYSSPPPAVFYPQSPYVYGPPPSAFASPPDYQQQYQYQYQERRSGHHDRDRQGRRDHSSHVRDRHDRQSPQQWQSNNRPDPGANQNPPSWGHRERR